MCSIAARITLHQCLRHCRTVHTGRGACLSKATCNRSIIIPRCGRKHAPTFCAGRTRLRRANDHNAMAHVGRLARRRRDSAGELTRIHATTAVSGSSRDRSNDAYKPAHRQEMRNGCQRHCAHRIVYRIVYRIVCIVYRIVCTYHELSDGPTATIRRPAEAGTILVPDSKCVPVKQTCTKPRRKMYVLYKSHRRCQI